MTTLWPTTGAGWVSLLLTVAAFFATVHHFQSAAASRALLAEMIARADRLPPEPATDWHRDELAAWDAEFARLTGKPVPFARTDRLVTLTEAISRLSMVRGEFRPLP